MAIMRGGRLHSGFRRGLAILGLLALPTVTVNALLMTGAVEKAVSEGELGFNLRFSFAWALIPDEIELRGLHLDGIDEFTRWEVELDRATLKLDLSEVLSRKLIGTWLTGEGAEIRVKSHAPSERPEIVALLREKDRQDRLENPYPPWTIDLFKIRLRRFTRAHIDEYRFEGDSEVSGERLFLQPKLKLNLVDATWKVARGHWQQVKEVRRGQQVRSPFVTDFRGDFLVNIHPTIITNVIGPEIFRTMDIDGTLSGRLQSVSFLRLLFPGYRTLEFSAGSGPLEADFHVDRGVLQPGSRVKARLGGLDFGLLGLRIQGNGTLAGRITPGRRLGFHLQVAGLRALSRRMRSRAAVVEGGTLRFEGTAADLSLVSPFEDLRLHLDAKSLGLRNLDELMAHFTGDSFESAPVTGEEVTLNAVADIVPSTDQARIALGLKSPSLTYRRRKNDEIVAELESRLSLQANLRSDAYAQGRFKVVDLGVSLSDLAIRKAGEKKVFRRPEWKADVELHQGELHFGAPFEFRGRFETAFSNAAVPVRFMTEKLSFWAKLGMAFFPLNNLRGEGRIAIQEKNIAIEDLELRSGLQRIAGHLRAAPGGSEGKIYLKLLPLPFCYSLQGPDDSGLKVVLTEKACLGRTQVAE